MSTDAPPSLSGIPLSLLAFDDGKADRLIERVDGRESPIGAAAPLGSPPPPATEEDGCVSGEGDRDLCDCDSSCEGASYGDCACDCFYHRPGPAFVLAPKDARARELYSAVREPGGARGDSGTDLYFPEDVTVPHGTALDGAAYLVSLGVRARCYDWKSEKTFPYLLLPRSSIAKTPLSLANSVGLIDAGYTGELKVALRNHSAKEYKIPRGTALFQLARPGLEPTASGVVLPSHPLFAEGASVRGAGGFGSTDSRK